MTPQNPGKFEPIDRTVGEASGAIAHAEEAQEPAAGGGDSSWTRARSLNTPDARRYTEWVLLVKDVEYALHRAVLWRDMAQSDTEDAGRMEIRMSLLRDAVVSLVSCFDDT